jgi:NAD-dependent dihydropyrimidine dehydrogenase PreA subunit
VVLLADRFLPGSGWLEMLALSLYAAWLVGAFLDPERHKKLRPRVWALFSAVFFGQLVLGLLGLQDFLMTGRLHLPVPALIGRADLRGGGLFMPILFVSTVILVGPAWCTATCATSARGTTSAPAWGKEVNRFALLDHRRQAAAWFWPAGPPWRCAPKTSRKPPLAAGSEPSRAGGDGPRLAALGIMALHGVLPIGWWAICSGAHALAGAHRPEACTGCGSCARACRYSALTRRKSRRCAGLPYTLCGDCIRGLPPTAGLPAGRAALAFTRHGATWPCCGALMAVFLGVARI